MLNRNSGKRLMLILIAYAAVGMTLLGEEPPVYRRLPKYQTPVPYAGIRNWHVTQNLGPTGARGWVYGHRGNTKESREILIKSVEPGSPADGILRPYDIIVGAAVPPDTPASEWQTAPPVKVFDADARLSLARAITWSESEEGRGELKLIRNRDGVEERVVIKLPVLGAYSPTAPFDCPKTTRVVKNAAALVAENMPPSGFFGLPGALNAMLLYAVGDVRYLDHVRRSACRMSINHTITDAGHETWRWGYINLFLAEYYLATGDKRVLPTIRAYCDVLAKGQCHPGTWGHRAVPDFIPPGYGSMNQSGLICFLSMVLGRRCGVDVDAQALRNSIGFYGSYAGVGGIPYGDHPPHAHATGNGKNGSAAVTFAQLQAEPAEQWFARLCGSANLLAFEGGHTGNFFNQTWSPLGAALAGRENYQRFWARFNSYRDLARRWDASFVTQPFPNTREGDLGTGNYVRKGPMWSTGGFTLSYLAGTRQLAVLGRKQSVFGASPPSALKPALALYHRKQFEACETEAAAFADASDPRLQRLAKQLQTAARRNQKSLTLTLTDMRETLSTGDLYKLKWQLQAIEALVEPADTRLADFRAAVEDPANAEIITAGQEYHRITSGFGRLGLKGFEIFSVDPTQSHRRFRGRLRHLAKAGKGAYRQMAKAYLDQHPILQMVPDTPLTPLPAKTGQAEPAAAENSPSWQLLPTDRTPDPDWTAPGYDDTAWQAIALPDKQVAGKKDRYLRCRFDGIAVEAIQALSLAYSLNGHMEVYLNGTRILDVRKGRRIDDMEILLKPVTRELLDTEANCLAVKLQPGRGDENFKLVLKALRKTNPKAE